MRTILIGFIALFALSLQGQNLLDDQGRKTGPWKVEYPNGKTLYEATFQKGIPVGEMVRYYENGGIRARMDFDSTEDRSFTTLYYKNGRQAAAGWYVQQLKDSVWTYYSEIDGTVRIREPYHHGNLHGKVQRYYPSGLPSEEVSWKMNNRNGPWVQYYEDGSRRLESQYENDTLNGPYEVFYADSTLKVRGRYLDNLNHGTWSFYDENGSEVYTIEYVKGKAVDQEKYDQLVQDSLNRFELIAEPESMEIPPF